MAASVGCMSGKGGSDKNVDNGSVPAAEQQQTAAKPTDEVRAFESGIRTENVDGIGVAYIIFSADSLQAELVYPESSRNEVLERRSLPKGGYAWNVEDDDTKNVRFSDGAWVIEQRGKVIFHQPTADTDASAGEWLVRTYEGDLPSASGSGIRYTLTVRNREHSGDGTFLLVMTYIGADNGKDESFASVGRRYTLRGMAGDDNATVWQMKADDGAIFNFLYDGKADTLTLLSDEMEKAETDLNYTLHAVKN